MQADADNAGEERGNEKGLGHPPHPDGGWSSEIVTLQGAVIYPPEQSAMIQHCGVLDAGGAFCEHSATWRGGRAMMLPPAAPVVAQEKLAGRHLFAGQLWAHFGHFMAESMSRLWALDALDTPPDSIIFAPKRPGKTTELHSYQKQFIDLLGINIPVQVIEHPTEVEELIVPGQGFGLGAISAGTKEFRHYFRDNFAKDITADGPEKIYLSRTALGGQEGGVVLEEVIESNLQNEGYQVIHPQQLSIAQQVAVYRGAKKIVGLDGSAFHLFGFVGTKDQDAAIILRRNSKVFKALTTQIEAFCGAEPTVLDVVQADWIPVHKNRPGRYSFGQLDFQAMSDRLTDAGFIEGRDGWVIPRFRDMKKAMAKHARARNLDFRRVRKQTRNAVEDAA